MQSDLWQSFIDPLTELLVGNILNRRDTTCQAASDSGDLDADTNAVMNYQITVTEAAHNAVLLHLVRCMGPILENNMRQNFELLYSRREMLVQVSSHCSGIVKPWACLRML